MPSILLLSTKSGNAFPASIAAQLRYAVLNTDLAGVPYQIVARITYADSLREHVESVSGFTVNLDWVKKWYFAEAPEIGRASISEYE